MGERLPQCERGRAPRPGRRRVLCQLGAALLGCATSRLVPAQRHAANAVLLVASANLRGSIFAASVVLVLRAPGEDTIGVIVNRPGGAMPPGLVLPEPDGRLPGTYRGGPLSPGAPFAIAEVDQAVTGTLEVTGTIRFAAGPAGVRALLAGAGAGRSKVFLGYAGWAPGQLAREIAAGFWSVHAVMPQHLFDPEPADQWMRLSGATQAI